MGLFTDGFKLLKKASEPLYKTPKSIQETIEDVYKRQTMTLESLQDSRKGAVSANIRFICSM